MKSLSLAAVLACAALTGCVVAPVGAGYYGHRPAVVAPAVLVPAPVVVRPGYGRGGARHDRYERRDRGDGRGRYWRHGD